MFRIIVLRVYRVVAEFALMIKDLTIFTASRIGQLYAWKSRESQVPQNFRETV